MSFEGSMIFFGCAILSTTSKINWWGWWTTKRRTAFALRRCRSQSPWLCMP